jgi:hypothetical protein
MCGLQKMTEHAKPAGKGVSFSIVFRRLLPFTGSTDTIDSLTQRATINWFQIQNSDCMWRMQRDMVSVKPRTTLSTGKYNELNIHKNYQSAVSSSNGYAKSLRLHGTENIIRDGKVFFPAYSTTGTQNYKNKWLLNNYQHSVPIHVSRKLAKNKYEYLGEFYVHHVSESNNRMYFYLQNGK